MPTHNNVKFILKFYIDDNDETLKEMYKDAIKNHNNAVLTSKHPDSGFDLYTPLSEIAEINNAIHVCHDRNQQSLNPNLTPFTGTVKGSMKVKTAMYRMYKDDNDKLVEEPCGFYLFPRSSISKTRVRLANNTGIIDSGYRGCLAGMFDILPQDIFTQQNRELNGDVNILDDYHRLLQICSPSLEPFIIELLLDNSQLDTTERGGQGFGSTGTGQF